MIELVYQLAKVLYSHYHVDHVSMAVAQYLSSGFSTGEISPERKFKKIKRK
jgi:hypothetical protein